MPKLVLARGDISPTDELVTVLSEPRQRSRRGAHHLACSAVCGIPDGVPNHS